MICGRHSASLNWSNDWTGFYLLLGIDLIEMRPRVVPGPLLVLLAVALAVAVPAVALGATPPAGTDAGPVSTDPGPAAIDPGPAATDDGLSENKTGVQMTAYMQSTAEEANATVETGLWMAGIERSPNPDNRIRDRAADLAARLERLRNRTESLNRTRENGSLPPVVYNARAAALDARVDGLQQAVEATAETADRYGVNVSKLDTLRAEASNLSGPEVAAIARNLTTHGPPAWAGNETAGPPSDGANRTGPPENPGQSDDRGGPGNSGNASSAGDGNAGNGSDGRNASGPVDKDDSANDEADSTDDEDEANIEREMLYFR